MLRDVELFLAPLGVPKGLPLPGGPRAIQEASSQFKKMTDQFLQIAPRVA